MSNSNSLSHEIASSHSFRVAVVTISDTRTPETDDSGRALMELVDEMNWEISESFIVRDERELIAEMLRALVERGNSDLILTTGGTGFSKRDVTPEATRDVIEREAPGLAEAMRFQTAERTQFSMLSRGVAGIKGDVLIINLPGSTNGVRDCFSVIAPVLGHALEILKK